MLRERSYIKEIEHLKLEVERKFGRRILISSDCITLANEIYRKTNNRISFNTVRRCFNIMKSDYQPSLHTLDSLAIYCGFASFGSFVALHKKLHSKKGEPQADPLLNYMLLLFNELKFQPPNDITYLEFTRLSIVYLNEHRNLIPEVQKHLSSSANGHIFYFEYFINIDKLNSFYGQGLHLYLAENKSNDEQVFGLSLLCLQSWLTNNQKELEEFYFKMVAIKLDKSTSPIIWARYFAALLLYYHMRGYAKEQILIQSRRYFESSNLIHQPISFQTSFEIIMAEALLLTDSFEEAFYYLQIAKNKEFAQMPEYVNQHNIEVLKLFTAWVFLEKNLLHKARELIKSITPGNFFFLSNQYYGILYQQVKLTAYKSKKSNKELNVFIKETGFIKLHTVLQKHYTEGKAVPGLGKNGQ